MFKIFIKQPMCKKKAKTSIRFFVCLGLKRAEKKLAALKMFSKKRVQFFLAKLSFFYIRNVNFWAHF